MQIDCRDMMCKFLVRRLTHFRRCLSLSWSIIISKALRLELLPVQSAW